MGAGHETSLLADNVCEEDHETEVYIGEGGGEGVGEGDGLCIPEEGREGVGLCISESREGVNWAVQPQRLSWFQHCSFKLQESCILGKSFLKSLTP